MSRRRLVFLLGGAFVVIVAIAFFGSDGTNGSSPSDALTETGGNILVGDKATFDTSSEAWVGLSASLAHVDSPTQGGTGALSLTATPAGPVNIGALSGSTKATLTPAAPGTRYTATAWMRGATERATEPVVIFYDSAATAIAYAWGPITTDAPDEWRKLVPAVGIAPPNAAYAAVGVIVYAVQTHEVHYVDSVSLTPTSGVAKAIRGPMHTSGNQILDADEAPVVLRGVHRYGLETSATPKGLAETDIAQIKAWGANFVRVSLADDLWVSTSCRYDPTLAAAVDRTVQWITSRGMVALVDLHHVAIAPCGASGNYKMPDAAMAIPFWTEVAARYKANPLVAFDLYNEPHYISDAEWRDGGTITDGDVTYEAVGMQKLYDTVRAQGAPNLVFATGNAWGNKFPSTAPLTGTDIVYAAHAYRCPQITLADCTASDRTDPSPILRSWVGPSETYPVMVTEFGWPDHNDGSYLKKVIAFAEDHGWGWDAFGWDASNGPFALAAGVGTPGAEPSPAGMVVLAALAKND